MQAHVVGSEQGEHVDLGAISMRLLASSSATGGAMGAAEFRGSEGQWTIPHVHELLEESFYVLEGSFSFTCGDRTIQAQPGSFVLVPRGTPHVLNAAAGGGALLVCMDPGRPRRDVHRARPAPRREHHRPDGTGRDRQAPRLGSGLRAGTRLGGK